MSTSESVGSPESITALDYIESQRQLENEALDILPYDPTHCTYFDGPLRQSVYACLTCIGKSKDKHPAGVCYSCSIQCHSDHDLVELFNKRNFVCDCGTSRLASFGGCNLRKNFNELDIESSSNRYDHNFEGRFCSCDTKYDPENERGTMYQCLLGDACNEDWYHEECILGLPFVLHHINTAVPNSPSGHPTGKDLLDFKKETRMPPSPKGHPTKVIIDQSILSEADEDAEVNDKVTKRQPKSPKGHPTGVKLYPIYEKSFEKDSGKRTPSSPKGHPTGVNLLSGFNDDIGGSASDEEGDDDYKPPEGFPGSDTFEAFICWKCVAKHRSFFSRWAGWEGVALAPVIHKDQEDFSSELLKDLKSSNSGKALASILTKRKFEEQEEEEYRKRHSTDNDNGLFSPISIETADRSLSSVNTSPLERTTSSCSSACSMPPAISISENFSLFLVEGWREKICHCKGCMKIYDQFPMLDKEEMVYEPPKDDDETSSLLDAGTKALNSMPHLSTMESIYAYNKIKERLSMFLKPFADEGKIVTEQDVKTFFSTVHKNSADISPSTSATSSKPV
ncbi:hypothetical protein V1511DRAFT_495589 [Dipodascopsis uninucleata]